MAPSKIVGSLVVLLSILLLTISIPSTSASTDLCDYGDSNCPSCPEGHTLSFNTLIIYSLLHPSFDSAMEGAQKLMKSYDQSEVLSYVPPEGYHTTLNYFCCYSSEEKETILSVLKSYKWQPMKLTYNETGCNVYGDYSQASLHALASPESQDTLFELVRGIEAAVEAAGVPINTPRHQSFHSTLGNVKMSYPTDEVVQQLRDKPPAYGTVDVSWFIEGLHIYHAQS